MFNIKKISFNESIKIVENHISESKDKTYIICNLPLEKRWLKKQLKAEINAVSNILQFSEITQDGIEAGVDERIILKYLPQKEEVDFLEEHFFLLNLNQNNIDLKNYTFVLWSYFTLNNAQLQIIEVLKSKGAKLVFFHNEQFDRAKLRNYPSDSYIYLLAGENKKIYINQVNSVIEEQSFLTDFLNTNLNKNIDIMLAQSATYNLLLKQYFSDQINIPYRWSDNQFIKGIIKIFNRLIEDEFNTTSIPLIFNQIELTNLDYLNQIKKDSACSHFYPFIHQLITDIKNRTFKEDFDILNQFEDWCTKIFKYYPEINFEKFVEITKERGIQWREIEADCNINVTRITPHLIKSEVLLIAGINDNIEPFFIRHCCLNSQESIVILTNENDKQKLIEESPFNSKIIFLDYKTEENHVQAKDNQVNFIMDLYENRKQTKKLTPFDGKLFRKESIDLINDFINKHTFNVTQLEEYARCPMHFFLNHILNLKVIKEDEQDTKTQWGKLFHYIVCEFYKQGFHLLKGDEEKKDKAIDIVNSYLNRNPKLKNDIWIEAIIDRLFNMEYFKPLWNEFIENEKNRATSPLELEWAFGEKTPVILELGQGYSIKLRGIIDRIDVKVEGKEQFGQIIDYKTGSGYVSKRQFESGLIYQIPVYFYAACLNVFNKQNLKPGYGIYYRITFQKIKDEILIDPENYNTILAIVKKHILEDIKAMKHGYFNPTLIDPDSENGSMSLCNYCDFRSGCQRDVERFYNIEDLNDKQVLLRKSADFQNEDHVY